MKNCNDKFEGIAAAFVGAVEAEAEVAFAERLDRNGLDYSLASLRIVDSYLKYVHEHRDWMSDEKSCGTVLYAGAYVGEVIRENAARRYDWVEHQEYMRLHPNREALLPNNVATCAFLCAERDVVTMPMDRVASYIDEGPENNTFEYASMECG